jgi:hypothetical protein
MAAAPKILQDALNEKSVAAQTVKLDDNTTITTAALQVVESALMGMAVLSSTSGQAVPSVQIDDDLHGWLLEQAAALRDRRWRSLDVEHLAEELEDMAALRREALRSDLIIVLVHMLKLAYETRPMQKRWRERQWKLDLVEHRDRINQLLAGSATLRVEFEGLKGDAYTKARKRAGLAIHPQQAPVGPDDCPWTTEQILNEDFFP